MPPEFIDRKIISKEFDIFSLGVVIIQIVAGREGRNKCEYVPSEEFADLVRIIRLYQNYHTSFD